MRYHILLTFAVCLIGAVCAGGLTRKEKYRLFWTDFAVATGLVVPFFALLPTAVQLVGAVTVIPAVALGVCLGSFVKEINFTDKNDRYLMLILAFFVFSVGGGIAGGHLLSAAGGLMSAMTYFVSALSLGTLLWRKNIRQRTCRIALVILPFLIWVWLPPQGDRFTAITLSMASGALLKTGYSLISNETDRTGLMVGTVIGMALCIF